MKTNRYYAMQWHIDGVHALSGRRCANYFWFSSRVERDAWVDKGFAYRGKGYREAVPASDAELRALQRVEKTREEKGLWIEGI